MQTRVGTEVEVNKGLRNTSSVGYRPFYGAQGHMQPLVLKISVSGKY